MEIHIHRLPADVSLGVYDWEKRAPRRVVIDVWLRVDGTAAAASDSLEDTIDYAGVEQTILRVAGLKHYQLVETLAAAIGQALLAEPLLQEVTVRIEKPGALAQAESVFITETYKRLINHSE